METRDGRKVELGRMKNMRCNEIDLFEVGWNKRTFRDGMWWNDIEWRGLRLKNEKSYGMRCNEVKWDILRWNVMNWNWTTLNEVEWMDYQRGFSEMEGDGKKIK